MYAIEQDNAFRRIARRMLALLGLSALLLAAGIDTADAATASARALDGATWIAFAVLAVALFAVFRFVGLMRGRRAVAVRRRRPVARIARR